MEKLCVAIENLRYALEECGLSKATVDIKCYRFTTIEAQLMVRDIMLAGFGNRVISDNGMHRYKHRDGSFSWLTLEQEGTRISLFHEYK